MKFNNIHVVKNSSLIRDDFFKECEKEIRRFISGEYCNIEVDKNLIVEIRCDKEFSKIQGQFDVDLSTGDYIIRISLDSFSFLINQNKECLLYFQNSFLHELTHLINNYSGEFITIEGDHFYDINYVMDLMINEYTAERISYEKYPSCNRPCLQDYIDRRKKLIESRTFNLEKIYNEVLYCVSSLWSFCGEIEQDVDIKNSPFAGIPPIDKGNLDIIGQGLSCYYETKDMYLARKKMENALKDFLIDLKGEHDAFNKSK